MFDALASRDASAVLVRFQTAVDDLLALELDPCTDDEVLELLRGLERQSRRLAAADHTLVGQVETRGLPQAHGATSTAAFLARLLRLGHSEARARVSAAEQLGSRQVAGQVLEPAFPATSAAQATGEISSSHARIVTRVLTSLPSAVVDEQFDELESQLVGWAQEFGPDQLGTLGRHLGEVIDPDGVLHETRERERRRDLTIHQRPDGSVHGSFEGTAAFGEALLTILDKTAAPRPLSDGERDPRTPGQRRHDGLLDALNLVLRSEQLGRCHGITTTILLTMTEQQLRTGDGLARTGHGASVPVREAIKDIGAARIVPVTLDGRAIVEYGTSHRIFTEGQRLAMIARDNGCSFPGCTAGPAWCEAHHMTEWRLRKRTSVDDGALLCGHHHRTFERFGWVGRMIDGVPHWRAPAWQDPSQQWQRNTAHDATTARVSDRAAQPAGAPSS